MLRNRLVVLCGLLPFCLALPLGGCGDDCEAGREAVEVGEACTFQVFAAEQPLQLQLRAEEAACASMACSAERSAGDLFLTVERDACAADDCDAPVDLVTCELPALQEGGYTLRVNGQPAGMLHVDADAPGTSCLF